MAKVPEILGSPFCEYTVAFVKWFLEGARDLPEDMVMRVRATLLGHLSWDKEFHQQHGFTEAGEYSQHKPDDDVGRVKVD